MTYPAIYCPLSMMTDKDKRCADNCRYCPPEDFRNIAAYLYSDKLDEKHEELLHALDIIATAAANPNC